MYIPLVILMTSHTSPVIDDVAYIMLECTSNSLCKIWMLCPLQSLQIMAQGPKCVTLIHMYTYLEIGRIAGCMKIFAHGISRDFFIYISFSYRRLCITLDAKILCQTLSKHGDRFEEGSLFRQKIIQCIFMHKIKC